MSTLNKLLNNNNQPKPQNNNKKKRKPRVKGRRLPNNRRRRANIIRGRKIAAASAQNFVKKFTMLRQNGNSVRVTGRDLIYSIPDDLTSPIQDTNVITVIPANPAYWKGTRIAALASGYQNYRPILFKITYIPMCAVTQQGNVIGGTIWDDGIDNDNLQQSLRTSNGGFMTQCYVPHTTKIRPKSNLQFNLYRMGGEFSTTSNPFIFIALAIGCKNTANQRITPGYFYVTWSFELKNPIGSINNYNNSGLITYSNLTTEMNTTLINIDPTSDVPFGAYIDIEQGDEDPIAMYNGTPIEISENTPIWAFTSVTRTSTAKTTAKMVIEYNGVTTTSFFIEAADPNYKAYLKTQDDYYDIYYPALTPAERYSYKISNSNSETILLIGNINQNFGTFVANELISVKQYDTQSSVQSDIQINFAHYRASKESYITQIINKRNKGIKNNITLIKKVTLTKTQNNQIKEAIKEEEEDTKEKEEDQKDIKIPQQTSSDDEVESEILLKHKSKSRKKKLENKGE
jgi:hypothetical protein